MYSLLYSFASYMPLIVTIHEIICCIYDIYYVTVKVWSNDWKLQFVFVGHTNTVTDLAVYPWGPQFMSISDDDTLRVWNLEVFDQVDK